MNRCNIKLTVLIPALIDSLEEARSEVERLEAVYESRRQVYESIAAWRTHWAVSTQSHGRGACARHAGLTSMAGDLEVIGAKNHWDEKHWLILQCPYN